MTSDLQRVSKMGYIGMTQEAEFGEDAGAPAAFGSIFSETMMMNNNFIKPEYVMQSRYKHHAIPGRIKAGGGIEVQLEPEGVVPWILKGIFGKVESVEVASGVHDHKFTPYQSSRPPSFNLLVDHYESSQTWLGCSMDSATIAFLKDEFPGLSVNVASQRPKDVSQSTPPVFPDVSPWPGYSVSFVLNGEENPKFENVSLIFDNNIDVVNTMNGTRYCSYHKYGFFDIEGRITVEFETDSERHRFWGALTANGPRKTCVPGSFVLTAVHPMEIAPGYNYSLTLRLPEIYYESAPANIIRADDRILQTISFFPIFNAQSQLMVELTLRNGCSGYPAP